MKIKMYLAFFLLVCMFILSCSDKELSEPVLGNTQTDMEVLARFVDVNLETNEYFINENIQTRSLSNITGDYNKLQKVSPLSREKYQTQLDALNAQVAQAVQDPENAYMVFSVEGKTLVKKLRDADFGFDIDNTPSVSTRALPGNLDIFGGSEAKTGEFRDASRTMRMQVNLDPSVQFNYYYFQIASPDASASPTHTPGTPTNVSFSGTGMLWNTSFTWTAYYDTLQNGTYKWSFQGRGNSPGIGHIAQIVFSY